MAHTNIVIGGRRIGRLRASFLLFKETMRFLSADTEMLLIPVIASIIQAVLVVGLALLLGVATLFGSDSVSSNSFTAIDAAWIFVGYLASAFAIAWTQAAIAHMVYVRAHGGNASLGDGIATAFRNWSALLLWSVITSTVGIILRSIAERSTTLVKILMVLIGGAWSVLTYFVVPSIVIGNRSAFSAIQDSGVTFKRTWGETLVTNVSIGFVIVVALFVYTALLICIGVLFNAELLLAATLFIFFILGALVLSLISATLNSILRTLLYMYASESLTPVNFNKELLDQMFEQKGPSVPVGTGTTFVGN